jgi:hypothetical protein
MSESLLLIITLYSLILGFFEIYNQHSKKIPIFLYLTLFIIFITFREQFFPDTIGYIDFFSTIDAGDLHIGKGDLPIRMDIGYQLFNQLVKLIFGSDYHYLFLLITILNLIFVYLSVNKLFATFFNFNKKTILWGVLFSLYISYYGFLYNGAVLRAGLALSFLLYAYVNALNKRWIWAVLFLLIATQFHSSAIIGALVALTLMIKSNIKKHYYVYIYITIGILYLINIGQIIVTYFPQIFNFISKLEYLDVFSKYENIIGPAAQEKSLRILYFYGLGGFFLFFKHKPEFYRFLNVYYIGLLLLVLFPVSYVSRLTDFFTFFVFILLYLFLSEIKQKGLKMLIYSFIIISNTVLISRVLYQSLL